ncbi:hypothetical protein [Mucilaginibacter dorajii]|uniref:Uncharacterized protein n=1 Tax=Mucilaginibacter dorajii TaxID=692994 RepID=A0ABP7RAY1_9SPHI|nr:hypothetical protein [Mucilaginibacter dorajii]MCS3736659.1 hypothetical protein [Mucilaginibacter dorajii]
METKLTELYANGCETFIDEQAEAPGSPENCFDELIALTSTQQNAQFYEYHQALDCLDTMKPEDRLYLLKTG